MAEPRAAAYLDVSVGTFRAHIRPRLQAIELSPNRIGYDRRALDALVDLLSGIPAPSDQEDGSEWLAGFDDPKATA